MLRFEEALERYRKRRLTADEAGELLGMSGRNFRRLIVRYDEDGDEGLRDRRLGRVSPRRAPAGELTRMQILYQERYRDFTVKHFHERGRSLLRPELQQRHDYKLGYTVTRLALQGAGLVAKAKRRGTHRKKRERRPRAKEASPALPGMLLFQSLPRRRPGTARPIAGSPGSIAISTSSSPSTMRPAQSTRPSWWKRREPCRAFRGSSRRSPRRGCFARSTPTAVRTTSSRPRPAARACPGAGRGRQEQAYPGWPSLGAAWHHPHPVLFAPSCSPGARGRMERAFGTLQKRLPPELRDAGIATAEAANRYLKQEFVPDYNARFAGLAEEEGSAFIPYAGRPLEDTLCIQQNRQSLPRRRPGSAATIA